MTLSKEIQDCPNQGHRLNALYFPGGKIGFLDFCPCKRFDILQLWKDWGTTGQVNSVHNVNFTSFQLSCLIFHLPYNRRADINIGAFIWRYSWFCFGPKCYTCYFDR